jgi:hypothetical protein
LFIEVFSRKALFIVPNRLLRREREGLEEKREKEREVNGRTSSCALLSVVVDARRPQRSATERSAWNNNNVVGS